MLEVLELPCQDSVSATCLTAVDACAVHRHLFKHRQEATPVSTIRLTYVTCADELSTWQVLTAPAALHAPGGQTGWLCSLGHWAWTLVGRWACQGQSPAAWLPEHCQQPLLHPALHALSHSTARTAAQALQGTVSSTALLGAPLFDGRHTGCLGNGLREGRALELALQPATPTGLRAGWLAQLSPFLSCGSSARAQLSTPVKHASLFLDAWRAAPAHHKVG